MATRVDTFARKMGMTLISAGQRMFSSAFELKPTIVESTDIKSTIQSYFPNIPIRFLDYRYKLIGWADWKEIIEEDVINLRKYVSEYFDCDDFGYVFKYETLKTLGISCLVVYGKIYDKDKMYIDRHFWNGMIADGKLYFYEPMTDEWMLVEKGKDIISPNRKWKYEPIEFEF